MRDRSVRNRLDLPDLEHAQVSEPAVKAKQRIVVGTQMCRFGLASSSVIEHPADRDAINVCRGDAKADDYGLTNADGVELGIHMRRYEVRLWGFVAMAEIERKTEEAVGA